MIKLSFSGHETFTCRQYWLYKGYHFLKYGNSFISPDAVVHLGVGKNMVASIRFWMKSFGLIDDKDNLTDLADFLFGDKGRDSYIEDIGTSWLLHYNLVKIGKASIYKLVFEEFRIERIEFTKSHLHNFIKRKCDEISQHFYRESSVNKDINVFLRSYIPHKDKKYLADEDFSSLFYDLNLISHSRTVSPLEDQIIDYYKIENKFRKDLHPYIFLYSILDNIDYGKSISLKEIYDNESRIFAIDKEMTHHLLHTLSNDKYLKKYLNYSDTAGIKELQFKRRPDKWQILDLYYKRNIKELDSLINEKLFYN
jgi:hypothetical protein